MCSVITLSHYRKQVKEQQLCQPLFARETHSGSLTWKWKICLWKTILLYEQGVVHVRVSKSESITICPFRLSHSFQ